MADPNGAYSKRMDVTNADIEQAREHSLNLFAAINAYRSGNGKAYVAVMQDLLASQDLAMASFTTLLSLFIMTVPGEIMDELTRVAGTAVAEADTTELRDFAKKMMDKLKERE